MSTISPDSQMDRPIDSLVAATGKLVVRMFRAWRMLQEMDPDADLPPMIDRYLQKEEEMRQAYRTAIRLRAGEVSRFMESCGVKASPDLISREPLLSCLTFAGHMGCIDVEAAIRGESNDWT
jgi:hypothetical protein